MKFMGLRATSAYTFPGKGTRRIRLSVVPSTVGPLSLQYILNLC